MRISVRVAASLVSLLSVPGVVQAQLFDRKEAPWLERLISDDARQPLVPVSEHWPIEDCFRETKEELGLDHFECRGWRCIHRHLFATILAQLLCAHARQLSPNEDVLSGELLTMEQVRRAANVVVRSLNFPPRIREQLHKDEAEQNDYYARPNAQASMSHRMPRRKRLMALGINPEKIKSAPPKDQQ